MIYVTGDMHGSVSRFEEKAFDKLRSGDILIICGDFGFIWNGDGQEEKILQFMGRQKYKILFIDGCHENFDKLYSYPEDYWCGGKIHRINDNLFHLCRGQVFNIEGNTIFTMGGGYSVDAEIRASRGMRWWEEEMPTKREMEDAVTVLYEHSLKVDYIITHECPTKIKDLLSKDYSNKNPLTSFFDELSGRVNYKHWFFGSMHKDRHISSKHTAVYLEVVPLQVPDSAFSEPLNRYFRRRRGETGRRDDETDFE